MLHIGEYRRCVSNARQGPDNLGRTPHFAMECLQIKLGEKTINVVPVQITFLDNLDLKSDKMPGSKVCILHSTLVMMLKTFIEQNN